MHEIKIYDFEMVGVASSPAELESILARRFCEKANWFWFSPSDARYPCLAVMITGELAVVHWFPAEGNPGHQSLGEVGAVGDVRFIENNQGAKVWLRRSAVVGSETAIRCVEQFADDFERPPAIRLLEL